jgi:nucleotide-binding universal stress UspA family protein
MRLAGTAVGPGSRANEEDVMAIKEIVLHFGRDSRRGARLGGAIRLAQRFGARVVGVHVLEFPFIPGYVQVDLSPALIEQRMLELRDMAAALRAEFEGSTARESVPAEWRLIEGLGADAMALAARYADLAMVAQANPDEPTTDDRLPDELVLSAGRPVLVWPFAGDYPELGRQIMVAWNGTREAARAVHDAMDFLTGADKVVVSTVNSPDRDHIPGADIAAHLARHGIKAEVHAVVAPDLDVGNALLSAAADFGADMLVMGGYGHSRLRELALGGATRHLLASMTVPVLMSH